MGASLFINLSSGIYRPMIFMKMGPLLRKSLVPRNLKVETRVRRVWLPLLWLKWKRISFFFFIIVSVWLLPMHHLIVGCDQIFPCCVTYQFYYCVGKVSWSASGVWGLQPWGAPVMRDVWVKSVNEAAETTVEEFLHQILCQYCVQCGAVQMLLCIFKQEYD